MGGKAGAGYSIQYAVSDEGRNKEEVTGDLRFDIKTIAIRVIKGLMSSGNNLNPQAIALTVQTQARRELKEKYVNSGRMTENAFKKVLSQVTDKTIDHIVNKVRQRAETAETKENLEEIDR